MTSNATTMFNSFAEGIGRFFVGSIPHGKKRASKWIASTGLIKLFIRIKILNAHENRFDIFVVQVDRTSHNHITAFISSCN